MSVKDRITEKMQLPREIVLNYPKMTVISDKELTIENIIGIIEFSSENIRLNTETHILVICGKNLEINSLSLDEVIICGKIDKLLFE